jgi:outer membrane cobalamin receptor
MRIRVLVFFVLISTAVTAVSGFAQTVSGRVIDPSGRPLPRAYVHAIAPDHSSTSGVFTDTDGRFSLATPAGNCTIEVTLTGFESASAPCSDRPLEMKLELAPVSEHVIVSATRTEMPAGEVGNSVSVFDTADLERRQFPVVADVLLAAPGVAIERTGAYGGVTSAYVRGGESNYNKVLLDGIPLNEPGGNFNFNNVTSENLERIEIVRGAQSALFGSDAMASVIHLVTAHARPRTPVQGSVSAEGGSFGTGRFTGTIRGAGERTDYSIGVAHYTTNNEVPNNEFRNTTVSVTGGSQLTPAATLRAVFRGVLGKSGVPGQTAFGRADLDAFFDRRDIVGGVTFSHEISPKLRQQATYGLASTRQQSANLLLDEPYTPQFDGHVSPFEFFDFAYDSRSNLHRYYASYQADWFPIQGDTVAGTQHVTLAADWDGERGTLRDELADSETRASRDNIGLTIQHQGLWRNVAASAGVRFEHNDSFGNAAVPRASIAIVVHRSSGTIGQTRLKASAGTGIKEPTLLQSFSRHDFFLGNPDLEPERSRTVDAGVEQRLANDRIKLDVTWFDNHYRNIISTRTLSFNPFRSQYFNIGESKARGLELTGEIAPAAQLHARVGYTLTASEVTDSEAAGNTVFAVGNWLFRRPRHSGFAEVSWTDRRVSLDLFGSFVGQRVDSDFSSLIPPITMNDGHTRWDVRASYEITRGLALTAAIDNLADAQYMEPLGYPALGRAARVGIRAGF